ncbi:MAG: hypothetical protein HY561_12895, partial [Gemmatimonadetes bacterium]|nr:hypothetical protein [Gemmatimonadota bacterium]
AFTVWNQSNVNEKVYTVSLATIALLTWLLFRWQERIGEGKDDNLLVLMAFLAAPALILYVLLIEPRSLTNWKLYAAAAVAAVIGLSIHLFLPLRAGLDPVINEADPTCPTIGAALESILSFGRSGCENLSASLAREQYDKPSMFMNPITGLPRDLQLFAAQIGNYVQYFDWQWARSLAGNDAVFGGLRPLFTLLFGGLGLFGAWTHYRRDRVSCAYVAVLFATLSLGLLFYLNFKYGYSWPAPAEIQGREAHEVRERDYFFIVGFSLWGVWAGIGLAALWQRLAAGLADSGWMDAARGRLAGLRRPHLVAAPVLALGLIPLALNWGWASRAEDYAARDWAHNLLMSVEPYGVLFTNGDNDTFPLWYLQEVEGMRQDVTVIVMSYLNTPWYVQQLKQLTTPCPPGSSPVADPTRIVCQRPYEPEEGPSFYTVESRRPDEPGVAVRGLLEPGRRPPRESIVQLTYEQIDQIAATPPFATRDPLVFRAGAVESAIDRGTVMIPADMFMTAIITEAIDDRPVYFATTTQAYEKLNLTGHLIRQGVAFKLNNGPVQPDPARGIIAMPPENNPMAGITGLFLDLPRTDSLVWNVFLHRGGIPDRWTRWVDPATQGIPYYYAYTHFAAAQGHELLGHADQVQKHMERAQAWVALGQK